MAPPTPARGETLIRVAASGVNRADLSQIAGRYPPPPGEPDILGLEAAGTLEETGERVCALLAGGGHAELVAAPVGQVFPTPAGLDLVTAAGIPEAFLTAFVNLIVEGGLDRGATVLVHAGASGVGLAAIQLAKLSGARVAATTRSADKVKVLEAVGADLPIDTSRQDFAAGRSGWSGTRCFRSPGGPRRSGAGGRPPPRAGSSSLGDTTGLSFAAVKRFPARSIAYAVALAAACRGGGAHKPAAGRVAAPDSVPPPDTVNLYAAAGANALSATAARAQPLVYVPNSHDGTVTVIDPRSYRVLRTFATGALPQHVVPSYDLTTLWVANNRGNTLTPIDPATGRDGASVPVTDPYNLYFTPDGRLAIVVAERRRKLDFRDAKTMALVQSLALACKGVDHMEFTADGRFALATCEFSGQLVKVDLATRSVIGYLTLDPGGLDSASMPQDIRSSPDGRVFFVADMKANGVFLVEPEAFRRIGFIPTGKGTHGIYPSRDGRFLYVTNRGWNTTAGGRHGPGSISVLDPRTRQVVATWPVPGGGSPDMGNVSADGQELWVSGRYDEEVYVFDTGTGQLTHRIKVGGEPHGLCVWPQPGRYSLGHTGNMR